MSFTAYLVDDDPGVLKALARIVSSAGYETRTYLSPGDFLRDHDSSVPGCAILDLSLPGIDGLELQQRLGDSRPIIFLSGTADIPTSVKAMKAGAVDFLTKPVRREDLLAAVMQAAEHDRRARLASSERAESEGKLDALTPREREVLRHVIAGRLNKQIAASLGTVEKTVKVHRGRVMAKLGLRSVADLVRFAERAGISPEF